jgi:rhodanese-related sulfurtransferase
MQRTKNILPLMLLLLLVAIVPVWGAETAGNVYKTISTEALKALLDEGRGQVLVIDSRNPEEYEEVHIKNAVSIPLAKQEKDPSLLPADKSLKLIFYCNGIKCGKSKKAAKLASELGYRDLMVYSDGMPVWEEKGLPIYAGPNYEKKIETSRLAPGELKALMESRPATLTIVDVRDPSEFSQGHIPGAINIPTAVFASNSGVLDKEKRIVVYCNSGGRSYNAYRKLMKLAYPQISQVIFADWEFAGMPVEK